MNMFEFKTPLLLPFVYVEFRILAFKLFHNVYVYPHWLDLNLLIIYDPYLVFASGDFL